MKRQRVTLYEFYNRSAPERDREERSRKEVPITPSRGRGGAKKKSPRRQPSRAPRELPSRARSPKTPPPSMPAWGRGEFRVQRGTAVLVASAVVLVLVAGSLYLGSLFGSDSSSQRRLLSNTTSGGGAGSNPGPAAAKKEGMWTIRAVTLGLDEKRAREVAAFLESEGFRDLRGTVSKKKREIALYVSRADTARELEKDLERLRRLRFEGKRPFKDAYTTPFVKRR